MKDLTGIRIQRIKKALWTGIAILEDHQILRLEKRLEKMGYYYDWREYPIRP